MAWTNIKYACGHTEQVQIYGPIADRERRIIAASSNDCPACRAAASSLTGSDKQVSWAEDIRARETPKIVDAYDKLMAAILASTQTEAVISAAIAAMSAERDRLLGRTAARDWIDGHDDYLIVMRNAAGKAARSAAQHN